jgi:hypothetical protein
LPVARRAIDGADHPRGQSSNHRGTKGWSRALLARLNSEGRPIPFRRKKGGHNRPLDERKHAAYVQHCRRESRSIKNQMRSERKVRRERDRQKRKETRRRTEDQARRKARWDSGLPCWTDEEWENLERVAAADQCPEVVSTRPTAIHATLSIETLRAGV